MKLITHGKLELMIVFLTIILCFQAILFVKRNPRNDFVVATSIGSEANWVDYNPTEDGYNLPNLPPLSENQVYLGMGWSRFTLDDNCFLISIAMSNTDRIITTMKRSSCITTTMPH